LEEKKLKHKAKKEHVDLAIKESLKARETWARLGRNERLDIFSKAADLLADKWRYKLNAATILGQSKNMYQAEIDSACELIDFLRFNVQYVVDMDYVQPYSPEGILNKNYYRPLEGFVYAITPFNFTAIGGNLATAPAMLGNTVVWKPSYHAVYSNYLIMELLREAGLPEGVINFIPGEPQMITNTVLNHPDFAGVHYTGSTKVFKNIFKQIGNNIDIYKTYPRIVGETGGKDFIFAHKSANLNALAVAIIRGAFEFAGQKCSAASRAYVPKSVWGELKNILLEKMKDVKTGSPELPETLVNAVIHKESFDRCKSYIDLAKSSKDCEILIGGKCDDSIGYFVEPTIVLTTNPHHRLMVEEIFGPIITIYVYEDDKFEETLKLCDSSTQYGLTGAFFSNDRKAIVFADQYLENAAGNYYINDKPTGAVVGQQPFGGARASGTNDKAGSPLNLWRWVSCRTVKENYGPPTEVLYPYMLE